MSGFFSWASGQTDREIEEAKDLARSRKREAAAADDRAKKEKSQREQAEQEARAAEKEARSAIQIAEERRLAKESAEQKARDAQREEQRSLQKAKDAEKRAEAESRAKKEAQEKARLEKEAREEERRKSEARIQQTEKEKAEVAREAEQLYSEKMERERVEAEQRSFKWGPKKEPRWTEADAERLRQYVLQPRKDSEGNPVCLRLLVFGPTGHGKSSFCNGCRSAIKGDDQPSTYFPVAMFERTLTRGFHGAPYGDHWIIDMAGIFESNRISSVNIEDIASGKVPFYAEITDTLEVRDQGSIPPPAPGENDVSCVIIVLKYDAELGPELRRQIEVIVGLGGKGVISYHLVLTHLDECDPQFNDTDNLPNLYQSPRVQAAVKRMSEETGIPPLAISFVKNYTRETETDQSSALLHLRVIERVIKSALDQVEKGLDKKRQRALYSKPEKVQKVTEFDMSSQQDEKSGTSESIDSNFDKKIWAADRQKRNEVTNSATLTVSDVKFVIVVLLIALLVIYLKL